MKNICCPTVLLLSASLRRTLWGLFAIRQASSSYPSPDIASKAKQEKDRAALQIQTSYLAHRPHPSFPYPKEKGRSSITKPNFITTTSALYLYSAFSKYPIIISISEKRGLCVGGLLLWRRPG